MAKKASKLDTYTILARIVGKQDWSIDDVKTLIEKPIRDSERLACIKELNLLEKGLNEKLMVSEDSDVYFLSSKIDILEEAIAKLKEGIK